MYKNSLCVLYSPWIEKKGYCNDQPVKTESNCFFIIKFKYYKTCLKLISGIVRSNGKHQMEKKINKIKINPAKPTKNKHKEKKKKFYKFYFKKVINFHHIRGWCFLITN